MVEIPTASEKNKNSISNIFRSFYMILIRLCLNSENLTHTVQIQYQKEYNIGILKKLLQLARLAPIVAIHSFVLSVKF